MIPPLCKEKNIRFVLDVEPLTDYIPMMDSLRLNQVFFNLLSNAVKFTPEGGSVIQAQGASYGAGTTGS